MEWPLGLDMVPRAGTGLASPSSGSTNTKSSWNQLTAGLSYDLAGLGLLCSAPGDGVAFSSLSDLGIGGAGSEVIVIPNLFMGTYNHIGAWRPQYYGFWPLDIPKGTRIAWRSQVSVTSRTTNIYPVFYSRGLKSPGGPQKWFTEGANTANSRGVDLTSGTLATFGSWVEITASAQAHYREFKVVAGMRDYSDISIIWQIGIGGSGSEVAIVEAPAVFRAGTTNETPIFLEGSCNIPKGSRIAVRCGKSGSASAWNCTAVFYGAP